jgi:hypothetical protein
MCMAGSRADPQASKKRLQIETGATGVRAANDTSSRSAPDGSTTAKVTESRYQRPSVDASFRAEWVEVLPSRIRA